MGQKGPRLEVLKPGSYPINTAYLEVKQFPAVQIPEGSLGVLTRLYGEEPSQGTILVSKESQFRGIIREVLQPGTYYINPAAYKHEIVEAVKIDKGQVGVVTKRVGKMPPEGPFWWMPMTSIRAFRNRCCNRVCTISTPMKNPCV